MKNKRAQQQYAQEKRTRVVKMQIKVHERPDKLIQCRDGERGGKGKRVPNVTPYLHHS